MKLGLMTHFFGEARPRIPLERILRAEALGYDAVWTAETYGTDAITPLAFIGAHTRRIRLGTSIAQLAARSPANLAMCAQSIDAMAGQGRMIVGLGVSGPQIVEGWYGQPWGKPNHRLRDYVAIMKKILRREGPVAHDGREISLPWRGPGASGLGKPLKSILHGNPAIPILLGTGTDTNIRMTAEIADGWLAGNKWVPARAAHFEPIIAAGLARRTDGLKALPIYAQVRVNVEADVKAALAAWKPQIALYVGGMGARSMNFHKDNMVARGYGAAADRIQELFLAGRKDEATAAVPDEFVDEGALVGPPERIRARLKPWIDGGIAQLIVQVGNDEAMELMASIA
ncbi:MAG: LLM class F420-dependent oxidoreductase [Gammaproteobacteria bacterium]